MSATYTKDGKPVSGADIQWAASPPNTAAFSPNLSQTNSQGIASTTMTAYGPNQATSLTIVASSYDDTTQETVAGSLDVQVGAASTPPADSAAWLDLVSLEGDTLYGLTWHVLQVSYLYDDGQPVTGKRQIDWSTVNGSGAELQETSTWTDENGVATNMIHGPGTFHGDLVHAIVRVSTANPQTSQPDSATVSIILTANDVEPVSKTMTITVDGTQPINSGYACPISVKYTQADLITPMVNAPVTWAVYPYVEDSADPPYELSFGELNPTYTGDDGVAHNTISYNGTQDLPNAILVASCFNPVSGQTDFATTRLSFDYVSPLTGIMISRPWATNPASGNVIPSIPCQVVTARMNLASGEGDAQVKMMTEPGQLNGVQVYTTNGVQVQPVDGAFTVMSQNGAVEVLVGARFPTFFTLQAYYPVDAPQPLCDTDLWLSTLGGKYSDSRFPLTIENLDMSATPPLLTMPDKSTWPDPSFTVSLAASGQQLDPDAPLAILLNYRVAYTGKVADIQAPNSIDIAYAMLQPTGNTIAYFVGTSVAVTQRGNLTFDAQGQAQTYPWTGSISPILSMPALVPPLQRVTAVDIINGLNVRILPSSTQSGWKYQAGDQITVYFYLSGKYPLPDVASNYCPSITQPARNIATLRYTVQPGDELTMGQPQVLGPMAQALLAGYGGSGTLQLNFSVQRGSTTYWSKAGSTIGMDTATIDPSL